MTASFLHYISLFLSVFFVTNKMRLPCPGESLVEAEPVDSVHRPDGEQ